MRPKKLSPTTDPALRSLLQKAVRRGSDALVESTARRLISSGDSTWLRSRTVIITFEEAWPSGEHLALTRDHDSKIDMLKRVSRSRKQKDAAGMGAMAFALHEGDKSMLDLAPSRRTLRLVSEGLERPSAFFGWLMTQCRDEASRRVVGVATRYVSAAGWGWDKATILAGAFLAATGGVPRLATGSPTRAEFPYWVALDKHTPQGKAAFERASRTCGTKARQISWASFYCESASVDVLESSPWFECERSWRLRKVGLNFESALDLWERVRPELQSELEVEACRLRAAVEGHPTNVDPGRSAALFD